MVQTVNEIHRFTGFSKDALYRRARAFGLKGKIDPRKILDLKPLEGEAEQDDLASARTELARQQAELHRVRRAEIEKRSVPVEEVVAAGAHIGAVLNRELESLPREVRERVAEACQDAVKEWAGV